MTPPAEGPREGVAVSADLAFGPQVRDLDDEPAYVPPSVRWVECPACDGTTLGPDGDLDCERCGGLGEIKRWSDDAEGS